MTPDGRGEARRERAALQREEMTERILEATKNLLRKGSALEIRATDIAEEVGVSRQTIFQYYPVPRLIFFELADRTLTAMQDAIAAVDASEEDWEIRIATVAAATLLEDSAVNRQVLLISASQGRGADAVMAETRHIVTNVFQTRLTAGTSKHPGYRDDIAYVSLTLFNGLMYQWAAGILSDDEFRNESSLVVERVVRHGLNHLHLGSETE
jgi:AcrR family transcriptional regulator